MNQARLYSAYLVFQPILLELFQNANLGEYKMPTSLGMPNVNAIIVETNEPNGPFGVKEVGEGGIMPTIPAILNALYDATGVAIRELPLTPERV